MRFEPTSLAGAYLVHLDPCEDQRGMFARAFCAQEFAAKGLEATFVQANISTTAIAGTVRGMHFQREPHAEVKLVRCIKGSIYDVIVDMQEGSQTYLRWFGAELSAENGLAMYVPKGFAHGFQALTDEATVFYMVSACYAPKSEGGLRNDDPKLSITWPRVVTELSEKDAKWPLLPRDSALPTATNDPLVTIAIPMFNRASWLKECIISALAQSYLRFETTHQPTKQQRY